MSELEHVKCSTPDLAEETVKKILAVVPECEGETGIIDFDKLKQCLSSKVIEGNVERYEFTWPGKRAAKAAASAATTKTLRPCEAESVGKDGTPGGFDSENLYIEGDNFEVLKLLQTSYANQVKMIYIDPPYNTGKDFIYRDRFSLTQKELESEAGVFDEDGNKFEKNDSAEARYHSNWCSMMYPRLKLARNLLRDDGVIFISIDHNENVNLRKLCDDIFGESNFVNEFCWVNNLKGRQIASCGAATTYEFIVCYAKSIPKVQEFVDNASFLKETMPTAYRAKDYLVRHDTKGSYVIKNELYNTNSSFNEETRPTLVFNIYYRPTDGSVKIGNLADECPEGYVSIHPHANSDGKHKYHAWRWSKEKILQDFDDLEFVMDGGECKIYTKIRDYDRMTVKDLITDISTGDCKRLFDRSVFNFCKPVELLRLLIGCSVEGGIVLDFFSGSATTAQAVIQLNAEDGGRRKFILVQLPEDLDKNFQETKDSVTQNAIELCNELGVSHTLTEIGKERIRRAGKKIVEENAKTAPNLDIGFRVLKLDSSSLRETSATVSETTQEFANFERIKPDRSPEDLLFQMLLETHIPLSDPIETKNVGGNNVFFVSDNALVACLDSAAKMTTEFFIEIAKLKPGIAFFRDDAFADDSARTNLQQAFDQFSPTTSIKVI